MNPRVGIFLAAAALTLSAFAAPSARAGAGAGAGEEAGGDVDQFRKSVTMPATLWSDIAFHDGGDVAQYEATSRQSRDEVRRRLFGELNAALGGLAELGASSESMIEPMLNALLTFDLMHDLQRSRDMQKLNLSLGARFQASLDARYTENDLRDTDRKLQFSRGDDPSGIRAWAERVTQSGLDAADRQRLKEARDALKQVDYMAVGTFAGIGQDQFEVTLTMQNLRSGVSRTFAARGNLLTAVDDLATQVFEYFQNIEYPQWQQAGVQLDWLPMPANPERATAGKPNYGYSYQEAEEYCTSRGYRLPYLGELLAAEAGGRYRSGGIARLKPAVNYPVLDRRHHAGRYVVRLGENPADPEGALHSLSAFPVNGEFWCVKGEIAPKIRFQEELWRLHRQYQSGPGASKEVFSAIETLRYHFGEADARESFFNNQSTGDRFDRVVLLPSNEAALAVLRAAGVDISLPETPKSK